MMALPRTVAELTPQWLSGALDPRFPGITCTDLNITHVEWGTTSKVLIKAQYGSSGECPPPGLCIKGVFSEDAELFMSEVHASGAEAESRFYRDLATQLRLPLPRHWYAGTEPGQGIVILDDLAERSVTFGDPTSPWSPDQVAAGLDTLAAQHGCTWGNEFPSVPWITVGATVVRQAANALFSEQHWAAHCANPSAVQLPGALSDHAANLRAFQKLWAFDDRSALSLSHGDAHIGNTYVERDGGLLFLDWATASRAPWSYDVAYFVTGSLTVEDRRIHERALLTHYLDALQAHGGPRIGFDEAWLDYRRHQLHGLIWVAVPPTMQSVDRVTAMTNRYVTAIEDHQTLAVVGGGER